MLTARALLLDMDGTLVDSHAVVDRCWTRWANSHGLDPAVVLAEARGRQGHATMAALLPDRPMAVNLAENRILLAEETADTDGIVEVRGAAAFLDALRSAPHALVTSADGALSTTRMAAAGLPYPTVRVTAEDVAASKPDPEGFLRGAGLLGVEPADCVVFEDSAAGIAAARAAGMRVVGVGPDSARFSPDVQVDDLSAVTVTVDDEGIRLTFAS